MVPPEPIYDLGGITLYNAACEDVLPHVDPEAVALLLTDPPYGMSLDTDYGKPGRHKSGGKRWPAVEGDDEPFDPTPLLKYPRVLLWGANYFADKLPPRGSWYVWHKHIRSGHPDRGQAELAWTNAYNGPPRVLDIPWDVCDRKAAEPDYAFVHPTQKPVSLMRALLEQLTEPGDLVLDPYMGSGPLAAACMQTGRRYIGCEIVPEYAQTAVSRLAQAPLFAPAA